MKVEVKYVVEQWGKSAFEIKNNILEQCCVICPGANFSEVGLDNYVVDGCIEVACDVDDEEDLEGPRSKLADPAADP